MRGAHTAFAVISGTALLEAETPTTYREAISGPNSEKWRQAIQAEYDGCVANGTWKLVKRSDLKPGTNILPVKWVFKVKTDEHGAISKYKARITPKGFKQLHGIDFFETYADTGKYKTLRVMLSIAARRDRELRQLDVPQAFTRAALHEDVYMELPEGFKIPDMVCKLLMSLYGLKQAPRNWYILVSTFLIESLGFSATVSDPCLFFRVARTTGELIVIFLFVDDMQVSYDNRDLAEWTEYLLALRKRFDITDLGESKYMLGMRITRDRKAKTIKLTQELYITKALEKFGLDQCRPAPTPGVVAASTERSSQQRDNEDSASESEKPIDKKLYQEKVGTLLYASISTRPDIAYSVNKLAQSMQAPTVADGRLCDRVFRYLAGTKTYGLLFGRSSCSKSTSDAARSTAEITTFADADWGGDRVDRKSITGWVAMLNGDPVSWASKKQKVVSQSSCEAELYAEAAAINEVKWLHGLMKELGMKVPSTPVLFGDNQSTQELTRNGVKSERTKHIDIKYHFVTDEVKRGKVQLQWIPTTQQLADILTKALGSSQHHALTKKLMISNVDIKPLAERDLKRRV